MAFDEFLALLKAHGISEPQREYRFDPRRKWRFDYAWPDLFLPNGDDYAWRSVAVEVEGGAFTQGRHTRGAGYVKDLEKYNTAAICGWIVLRYTPAQLTQQRTLNQIKTALEIES